LEGIADLEEAAVRFLGLANQVIYQAIRETFNYKVTPKEMSCNAWPARLETLYVQKGRSRRPCSAQS